jgi:hypothetical protein
MNKEQFKRLGFSERHELAKGEECAANWQVERIGGDAAFYISCRQCGTELQAGCTPKCLEHEDPRDNTFDW